MPSFVPLPGVVARNYGLRLGNPIGKYSVYRTYKSTLIHATEDLLNEMFLPDEITTARRIQDGKTLSI